MRARQGGRAMSNTPQWRSGPPGGRRSGCRGDPHRRPLPGRRCAQRRRRRRDHRHLLPQGSQHDERSRGPHQPPARRRPCRGKCAHLGLETQDVAANNRNDSHQHVDDLGSRRTRIDRGIGLSTVGRNSTTDRDQSCEPATAPAFSNRGSDHAGAGRRSPTEPFGAARPTPWSGQSPWEGRAIERPSGHRAHYSHDANRHPGWRPGEQGSGGWYNGR